MNTLRYYRFPDKPIWKAAGLLVLYVLLILTRDTTYTYVLWGFQVTQAATMAIILGMGLLFLVYQRKNLKAILLDRRMLAAVAITVVFLIPMVLKREFQMTYFAVLLGFYLAVLLSYFLTAKEVSRYYVVCMTFIAVVSLIANYFVKQLVEEGYMEAPIISYNLYRHFYNFWITFPHIWQGYYRNYGLFREPGVYQFFLMLALYLNCYHITWNRNWVFWTVNGILAVTVITTFSTVGLVAIILLAVIWFFDQKLYRNKKLVIMLLACFAVAAAAVTVILMKNVWLFYEVYDMVEKLFSMTDSTIFRLRSLYEGVVIFFGNPVYGAPVETVLGETGHNTSSTLILFGLLGVLGGSMNIAAWVALVWNRAKAWWINLGLLVVLFMTFNTQNLTANLFFSLIPYMALMERGLPLLKLPQKKQ